MPLSLRPRPRPRRHGFYAATLRRVVEPRRNDPARERPAPGRASRREIRVFDPGFVDRAFRQLQIVFSRRAVARDGGRQWVSAQPRRNRTREPELSPTNPARVSRPYTRYNREPFQRAMAVAGESPAGPTMTESPAATQVSTRRFIVQAVLKTDVGKVR